MNNIQNIIIYDILNKKNIYINIKKYYIYNIKTRYIIKKNIKEIK